MTLSKSKTAEGTGFIDKKHSPICEKDPDVGDLVQQAADLPPVRQYQPDLEAVAGVSSD